MRYSADTSRADADSQPSSDAFVVGNMPQDGTYFAQKQMVAELNMG